MYADTNALAGFFAGYSLYALYMSVSGTVLYDAIITVLRFKPPFRTVLPPNIIVSVTSGVSVITDMVAEKVDSFILCTVVTAMIGSSLPLIYSDQFSL